MSKGILLKEEGASHIDDLIKKIQKYTSHLNTDQIIKAYEYSKKAHEGQKRRSGEPYITHPLSVANILVDLQMDQESIIVALLHDVVEDTGVSLEQIQKEFGSTVATLVDGVTKISKIDFRNIHQKQSENIRKMIVAMGKDVRVLLVKLADRLHNLRTLQHMPFSKQAHIANETLDIYTPLASRLGMHEMKVEMEDLSFKYSSPETFNFLDRKMSQINQDRERYSEKVIHLLDKVLKDNKIKDHEVKGRYKNIYSIHRKMFRDNISFEDIYDLVAFRICVKEIHECYEALGLVHSLWRPVPSRFKDFIAMSKPNHYQSLHTTVIGPEGQKIEIQIRTHEMHLTAERGIAAHWVYKLQSKDKKIKKETLGRFNWLQDLVSLHQNSSDSSEFLENVKLDLFEAAIYVFTPAGDIKEFPKGATPIDFAYSIHTDVGSKIVGAKVNSFQVPLKYKLRSGDTVEVITSNKQQPSKDWLKICVTSRARSKIKNHFKTEERGVSLEIGRKVLEKNCQKLNLQEQDIVSHSNYNDFLRDHGFNKTEDLYINLGVGKMSFDHLYKYLYKKDPTSQEEPTSKFEDSSFISQNKSKTSDTSPITIEGSNNILVNLAKCCNPVAGDSIRAYISPKKGIVIHRSLCWKLSGIAAERFIEVDWREGGPRGEFPLDLRVVCDDKPGTLSQLSEVFNGFDLNIIDIKIKREANLKVFLTFKTKIKNLDQLQQLLDRLHKVDSVISASRKVEIDTD